MSTLIENVAVVSSGKIEEREVWITDKRFSKPLSHANKRIDGSGLLLTPGLIDLQINGFGGEEFIHGKRALESAVAHLPRYGITSFLPTIPTGPLAYYQERSLEPFLRCAQNCVGAQPLGWHLEGPFINAEMSGIHPKQHILEACDVDFWNRLFGSKIIALVTLAPESPCGSELLNLLQEHCITGAIGHSNPCETDMRLAFDNGIRLVSHLFNAMPPFHHRISNLVGSVLGATLFKATIISDLVHVNKEALRIAHCCCRDRLAIISDGSPLIGSLKKRGRFLGNDIEVRGDCCCILGTNSLAGSALVLYEQLLRVVRDLELPFEQAIEMVTSVPASCIGLSGSKGVIDIGYDADCVFWEGRNIVATISKGHLVYALDWFFHRIQG